MIVPCGSRSCTEKTPPTASTRSAIPWSGPRCSRTPVHGLITRAAQRAGPSQEVRHSSTGWGVLAADGLKAVGWGMSADPSLELDVGVPGGSARREHERRRAGRQQRVRQRLNPIIGGALLALRDDPTQERAWALGAGGEERVAAVLAERLASDTVVLHDRRIPGSKANIDHIAVARSGIWVIDTKRYTGKVAVSAPLLGQAKLTINGRDQSKLIDGLDRQVQLVRAAAEVVAPGALVHGALCIVQADLPLLGTTTFRGYPLLYPRALAKRINSTEIVAADRVRPIAIAIAQRFPVA